MSLVKGFHQTHRPLSASELPGRLVTFLPAALLRGLPTPFFQERRPGSPPPQEVALGSREGGSVLTLALCSSPLTLPKSHDS